MLLPISLSRSLTVLLRANKRGVLRSAHSAECNHHYRPCALECGTIWTLKCQRARNKFQVCVAGTIANAQWHTVLFLSFDRSLVVGAVVFQASLARCVFPSGAMAPPCALVRTAQCAFSSSLSPSLVALPSLNLLCACAARLLSLWMRTCVLLLLRLKVSKVQ